MMVVTECFNKQGSSRLLCSNTGYLNLVSFIMFFKMTLLGSINLSFAQNGSPSLQVSCPDWVFTQTKPSAISTEGSRGTWSVPTEPIAPGVSLYCLSPLIHLASG